MKRIDPEGFRKNLCNALTAEEGSLSMDTDLEKLAGYDSLGKVSIAAMVSAEYGVEIVYEDFEKFKKVKDIIACMEKKLDVN